ncbi:MAG: slipin family protein [Armatimonadota bacterium]|nr:MAG: slipin family protein [Armatimonadota bacterium]
MEPALAGAIAAIILAVIVAGTSIRILREWERGVTLRLGRLIGEKRPGIRWLWPIIDKMIRIDLRIVTMDVQKQELMTRDNVPVSVDAVVYFRVMNANDAVVRVENYVKATSLIAQTTLRSILGQAELDELLAERDKINLRLQQVIDEQTEPWGIKVTAVEVRDVVLPEAMKRSMANQAETERARRAKVINAEGEYQAAQRLAEAAKIMSGYPMALQLRFLQTLSDVASEHNSTTIFPVPIDLFTPFIRGLAQTSQPAPPPQPKEGPAS